MAEWIIEIKDGKFPIGKWTELVRCKDCKWYREGKYFAPIKFCFRLKDRDGEEIGYNFASDDFCSYGERRKDGSN